MITRVRTLIGNTQYRLRIARERLIRFFELFYAHPSVRTRWGLLRYKYYSRRQGIQEFVCESDGGVRKKTVSHNLIAFENLVTDFTMRRMPRLINAVLAVETVSTDSRVLIIGPRTESDILILKGAGFANIEALDLLSYSPWVTLGDMHNMPFDDNSFDVVICGWTLPYSNNPEKVISEVKRVVRNGGIVAFGLEHVVFSRLIDDDASSRDPRSIDPDKEGERINSTGDLVALFDGCIENLYFNHDAPLKDLDPKECFLKTGLGSSQVMFVASVEKINRI